MKRKGFTMLEILIVIIIIAILATFAIPQYLRASQRAIAAEAVTSIGAVRGALARYYQENGSFAGVAWSELDIDDPNDVNKANFSYEIPLTTDINNYYITAAGNTGSRAVGIDVCYSANSNKIEMRYPGQTDKILTCGN